MDGMKPTGIRSLDMPGTQAADSYPATDPSPLTSSTTDDSHAKTELLSLDAMEFNLEGLSTEAPAPTQATPQAGGVLETAAKADRKSTRLNSSHLVISYAVFCLKKKKTYYHELTSISLTVFRLFFLLLPPISSSGLCLHPCLLCLQPVPQYLLIDAV